MRRRPWSSLLAVALSAAAGSAPWQAQAQTLTGAAPQTIAPSAAACRPDPLGGRALYLRGGFNNWSAADAQRFTWACNRHELVTRIEGEHRFKLGDEAWSADADFGAAAGVGSTLSSGLLASAKGTEFTRRFTGTHRFTFTMTDSTPGPRLTIEDCPVERAPLGETTLFLRGTMNNWAALDSQAFVFSCDAYYLNLTLVGRYEFKIADAQWQPASSFGAGTGPYLKDGAQANLEHLFSGAHTLRLAWAGGRPQLSIGSQSFADPRAVDVADPLARSLAFDSRSSAHKQPFGAVTAGTELSFTLEAAPGVEKLTLVVEQRRLEGNQEVLEYRETARVPMVALPAASSAATQRWQAHHRFASVGVHGYWFEAEIGGKRYAYQNNRQSLHWTREKGTGGTGEVAELPASQGQHASIRRFRQTVYSADFQVPDWAPDVVYYYVFPDRFRNGNPRNDPRPGRDKYQNHTVERHVQWNEPPFKPGSGDGSDAVYNNDFFGGDLAGLINKLDYIQDLGANTIYMTPVFKAASNHKYDTADYHRIDPAFGSNADFERLTREAARRGIRVIPDTSLNHVGSDSVYFDRYANHRARGAFEGGRINVGSPYADWFTFDATQTDPDKQYTGWVGLRDLPELNKASPAWRNFAYRDRNSVMKRWLDRGAAGWRMDVAPWIPDDFWREWRSEIKRHKPDALTVAETWFDASKYFLGDMFDSAMNYIFRNAVIEYAAGGKAADLVAQLEALREAYPPPAHAALMNLLSTHDAPRALYQFGWKTGRGETTDAAAVALAKQRLRLAVLLQMTYPGAPTVYYGDEVGVTGGEDPYNRGTYPWVDRGGQPDTELLADFKRLIQLRHDHAVLRRGSLDAPLHVDEHVIVRARQLQGSWALVATNNSTVPKTVSVPLPAGAPPAWRDALTSRPTDATRGSLTLTVPALFGSVLLGR